MTLPRTCCCGACSDVCCPCSPVYGYQTSWLLTWTGSITFNVPNCACVLSANGGLSNSAYMATTSSSVSGATRTVTWLNASDPLNCQLSIPAYLQMPSISSDLVTGLLSGQCNYDSAGPTDWPARISFAVTPPRRKPCPGAPHCTPDVGYNSPWTVTVGGWGGSCTWVGSYNCTNPGTFTLQSCDPLGCIFTPHQAIVVNASVSAGTVSLT